MDSSNGTDGGGGFLATASAVGDRYGRARERWAPTFVTVAEALLAIGLLAGYAYWLYLFFG